MNIEVTSIDIIIYVFFFYLYVDHRDLHSFPTRRSSDLKAIEVRARAWVAVNRDQPALAAQVSGKESCVTACPRSEEHTSELQSRPHLVCRLLLEKKKIINFI